MDPQAELLLLKASEDRVALALDLPDGLFGFVQQAFEKLFRALIAARNIPFDRTHDLAALANQLNVLQEGPLPFSYPFLNLQSFAVVFRYSIANPIDVQERQQIREALDALDKFVRRRFQEITAGTP